jgi:TPR repeat protein
LCIVTSNNGRTGNGSKPADFDEATKYYLLAIESGSVPALDAYAFHLEKGGTGLRPDRIDVKRAFDYYQLGAKYRHAAATLHLGEAYGEHCVHCQHHYGLRLFWLNFSNSR